MTVDRTWSIAVSGGGLSIFTEAQRKALEARTITAPDEEDAYESLADILGISLIPCCDEDCEEPCVTCARALSAEAEDRGVDLYRDEELRRENERIQTGGVEP